MRKNYFLFPQMQINSGGHLAQVNLLEMARKIVPSDAVTYETREENTPFLDDILNSPETDDAIFFVHWGPHVPGLIQRLAGRNVVYVSYSTGYGFDIPVHVPILAGSRHTQAYWGRRSPRSAVYYMPCTIAEKYKNLHLPREIDVLVQHRKSSRYLLEELVPALQPHCSVVVLDYWVADLAEEFNKSKIYLYDSAEYWIQNGVSEGFGLPPLEALACGCTVFSSVNDALSDYLEPGFNCQKINTYSLDYDVKRILKAVADWKEPDSIEQPDPAAAYRKDQVEDRLRVILSELDLFFSENKPPVWAAASQPAESAAPPVSVTGIRRFAPKRVLRRLRDVLIKILSRL